MSQLRTILLMSDIKTGDIKIVRAIRTEVKVKHQNFATIILQSNLKLIDFSLTRKNLSL